MEKSLKDIQKIVRQFNVKPNPEMRSKVLDEALALQRNRNRQSISNTEIWRLIMKSRITKFSAAAIVLAALITIYQFTGSVDGASVAWADVIKNIEQVNDYIHRQRQIDYSGVKSSRFEFKSEWEWKYYYSTEYGIRWDMYRSDELISQFYTLLKEQQHISIHPNEKNFFRLDESMPQTMCVDPRRHIRKIIESPHVTLGRQMIDGVLAEGIEVVGQKVSGWKLDDAVSRLWVDVQTQLPVRLESEGKMHGSDMFAVLIQDQFQWNVNLTEADFTPNIPADFTQEERPEPNPKRDEVVAAYTRQNRTVDFTPLETLGLLYDDQTPEQPINRLEGMEEINNSRDQMIRSWPDYDDLRQSLYDDLDDKLTLTAMPIEELVDLGVLLREKFWDAGGAYSPVSYRYAYMSRILLEHAYARRPDDLVIGDELAEAIMAAGTMAGSKEKGFAETLMDLRSTQLRQIREEVEAGRQPNWDDFARGCDLVYLASCRKPEEATATVDWLIKNASDGRWTSCLKTLQWMQPRVAEGKAVGFSIYYFIKPGHPEEFRYGGRLPSFKGPRSRIVIPIPEIKEPPPSNDQPEVQD